MGFVTKSASSKCPWRQTRRNTFVEASFLLWQVLAMDAKITPFPSTPLPDRALAKLYRAEAAVFQAGISAEIDRGSVECVHAPRYRPDNSSCRHH
ncbi:hypothetical protein CHELA20_40320 [Hyphomicrobiales bacterium]|nr:hypothetical protein CHELA20_40320 [Hyphomicrobiales bacterium]CAH1688175.1 hypothetical protein CHELA41_40177 [Hyphomicrobiales bacterium]